MASTYLLDIVERASKTAAGTAVALLTTNVIGIMDADWGQVLSLSGMTAVVSVLASIASSGFGRGNGTASLVPTVVDGAPGPRPL